MDDEVFEDYDRELELALYREYRDVVSQFQYVIETERRFYLANEVNVVRRDTEHDFYFEISMSDVWVWDIYRADRFVKAVQEMEDVISYYYQGGSTFETEFWKKSAERAKARLETRPAFADYMRSLKHLKDQGILFNAPAYSFSPQTWRIVDSQMGYGYIEPQS